MTQRKKMLPIGVESFEKIRKDHFYYVDKTEMIAGLLNSRSEVTLFTRPRRFGKTLNMSMLEAFFSPLSDKSLFDGLKITEEKELCEAFMGKYPVISASLKGINAWDFQTAAEMAVRLVRNCARQYEDILPDSVRLSDADKEDFKELLDVHMPMSAFYSGLKTLSNLLEKHYGQKVVILIDEYDVPLAKAFEQGYYEQMVILIRNLFEQALKTNGSLQFAVLTGCMRISKESIFTGLNNLIVRSISDEEYDEFFGFTDAEVRKMLEYYDLSAYYDAVKDWYDGYRFGQTSVYCPWDVISYCRKLQTDSDHSPENYWLNSSGNYAVRKFIESADGTSVKSEIESLINGDAVEKTIRQDLTYRDMYASVDNIWSVLYTTGYLTKQGRSGSRIQLVIPNREICNIFSEQILELFKEDVKKDGEALEVFCSALQSRDTAGMEKSLRDYLRKTISIRDAAVRKSLRENFYHGILLGILSFKSGWSVMSNQESGRGYSDIQIRDVQNDFAVVIEVKYADDDDLEKTCLQGLAQIEGKRYADKLKAEQYRTILKYGIAFYLKECKVMLAESQ